MKGHCPACGELVDIVPTGRKQEPGKSSEWQRIIEHPPSGPRCPGSGKHI